MFRRSAPQQVLGREMVRNQRMLQAGTFADAAYTCRLKALIGEFGDCGRQNCRSRGDSPLLFGSFPRLRSWSSSQSVAGFPVALPRMTCGHLEIQSMFAEPAAATLSQAAAAGPIRGRDRNHIQLSKPRPSFSASQSGKNPHTRPMVHGVDQHRDAEDVRKKDKLLPLLRAYLAGPGEKVDRVPPFLLG